MKKYVQEDFLDKVLLFMKWTTLLFAFIATTAFAALAKPATGQDVLQRKVTIHIKALPMPEALKEISAVSGVRFTYSGNISNSKLTVNASAKDQELKTVLDNIFRNYPYSYEVFNDEVIIRYEPAKEKNLKRLPVSEQNLPLDIKGKVTDKTGAALPGVTIRIKNTSVVTTSDKDGSYHITVPDEHATLVFSFIGMTPQEIRVGDNKTIDVVMLETASQLDQVKIIGYGTTTQRLATGNSASVKSDVLASQPVSNPLQALEGRVAGLQIIQGNGLPGSPMQVQIRGRNSITALNNPLYVIDGVPFTSTPVERVVSPAGTGSSTTIGSPLNAINPADIASIEILKDADATAIYGSRGSNGVILITTKKGSAGKTKFELNVNSGIGHITAVPEELNTAQYLQMRKDALNNSNFTPNASNAYDLLTYDPNAYTDWQKWYMGKNSATTDANGTLSGGDALTTFLVAGTYHHESTVEPGQSGYDRGAFHVNLNHNSPDKRFNINTNIFYTADNTRLPAGYPGIVLQIARNIPNYPTYTPSGDYNWVNGKYNYPATLQGYYKAQTDNLNGDINLSYELFRGLKLKANVGYNKLSINQLSASPAVSSNPSFQLLPSSIFGNQYIKTFLTEPQLTYTAHVSHLNIDFLAGGTYQQTTTKGEQLYVSNYANDAEIESLNFGTINYKNGSTVQYKYLSAYTRLTLNWYDKYILNGNFRRDGSSRFGPGRQYGNFGSIGAAWIFSAEQPVKDNFRFLSYGKLRASYGTTGNDGIGDYGYLNLYTSSVDYGSLPTLIPSQISNSDYQWEVNKKMEVGMELGFWDDRIILNSSWYRNRSGNQLVSYALPTVTGFSSYIGNLPAQVQNTGWEFELSTKNFRAGNFKWTTDLNITIPKNKLLSFPGLANSSYANSLVVGQSLNIIQRYKFLGVDPQTGLTRVLDVNNDGNFTQTSSYNNQHGDYVIAGTTDPKWYGGISNNFTLGNFQLTIFFQYTRQSGYNLYAQSGAIFGRQFDVWDSYQNYWKQPGDIVNVPKPFSASNNSLTQWAASSAGISDASYLRLKNLALYYTLPRNVTEMLKVKTIRVYLLGQNLWTLTKYNGYDPETATNSNLMIPPLKMITAGAQFTF